MSESGNTGASSGNKKELKWGLAADLDYVRSRHGIFVAAIGILSLIAFICGSVGRSNVTCGLLFAAGYNFFGFVSMSAFLTMLFNYVLYILSFDQKFELKIVPWALWDLLWCGVWGVLYLISSSVIAGQNCGQGGNIAAAIFGFIVIGCIGAHGFFAFMKFRETRGHQSSQTPAEGSAEKDFEQY